MKPLLALLSLILVSTLQAQEQQTFEQIVARIRATGDNEDFDSLASAKKLADVATVEQLASFLGEESVPVQLCAVQALGEFKKDPAVVLYLGSIKPEIKGAAAKAILGPPLMEMNLPQLAKSLEYGPTDPLFAEPAIEANRLLGTPDCSDRLTRYATFDRAQLPMREKALAELLTFETLTARSQDKIRNTLKPTLIKFSNEAGSPEWVKLLIALCEKINSPFTNDQLLTFSANYSLSAKTRKIALAEALSRDSKHAAIILNNHSRVLRQGTLTHWLQHEPKAALEFSKNILVDSIHDLPMLDLIQTENLQDIFLSLAQLKSQAADEMLSQSILAAVHQKSASNFLWLEIEEVIALRGEAISKEAREAFQNLHTQSSRENKNFPERAFPSLLRGGDLNLGSSIILTEKARCMECHDFTDNDFRIDLANPSLATVQLGSPEKVLRSLIAPNHDLVPGYETVTFLLKDGTEIKGR